MSEKRFAKPLAELTAIQVIDAALAAIENGTLQLAHCPERKASVDMPYCAQYEVVDYGRIYNCAIGAAIPQSALRTMVASNALHWIGELRKLGVIAIPEKDRRLVYRIQEKHDLLWSRLIDARVTRAEAVDEFIRYLTLARRAKIAADQRRAQQ